jgi:hypothetical protein
MKTNRKIAIKESKMNISGSNLSRWAGFSAMLAGIFYVIVGLFHLPNVLSSVTTTSWAIVHVLATAMGFFGILGMAGLYARQSEKSGWLGLAGSVLLSLWFAFILGFSFVEAFILPTLATAAPAFVEGFLATLTSTPSEINLGILPVIWLLTAPLYILGGLLFGIATFRAGILPRWAGALLAIGTVLGPLLAALLSLEHQPKVAIPAGIALAWLGYALWSERREQVSELVPDSAKPRVIPTAAK